MAASARSRARGLLGVRRVEGALLLEPCRSVHTLGMLVPIDIALCDGDLSVLAVRTLVPWRLHVPVPGTRAVLEAAAGALDDWGIAPGARLSVSDGVRRLTDRRARRGAGSRR